MGFFNTKSWTCFNCDRVNRLDNNYGYNTCTNCGVEYYVEDNPRETKVTEKQQYLSTQTFESACPKCEQGQFNNLSHDDEESLVKCDICNSYFLVGIDDEGFVKLSIYDYENGEIAEGIQENNEGVAGIQESFDKFIEENFPIPICVQCDDNTYELLTVNDRNSAIQVQCKTCNKKIWVKILDDDENNTEAFGEIISEFQQMKELIESKRYLIQLAEEGVLHITSLEIKANLTQKAKRRETIPKNVKQEVWERDKGRCVNCGSNEKLEYDHIIPIAKGGANTVRNIQLLCEPCNRTKSAKIQ